jgi:HSP20 family molecular chaperone IbpA
MLNQQGAGRGLEEKPERQIEPLIDVTSGERFIQVVAEIQGVDKNAIKLNATEKILNFLYLRASEKYAAS